MRKMPIIKLNMPGYKIVCILQLKLWKKSVCGKMLERNIPKYE